MNRKEVAQIFWDRIKDSEYNTIQSLLDVNSDILNTIVSVYITYLDNYNLEHSLKYFGFFVYDIMNEEVKFQLNECGAVIDVNTGWGYLTRKDSEKDNIEWYKSCESCAPFKNKIYEYEKRNIYMVC